MVLCPKMKVKKTTNKQLIRALAHREKTLKSVKGYNL